VLRLSCEKRPLIAFVQGESNKMKNIVQLEIASQGIGTLKESQLQLRWSNIGRVWWKVLLMIVRVRYGLLRRDVRVGREGSCSCGCWYKRGFSR